MKYIKSIIGLVALGSLLVSCDVNDDFEGYDELAMPTDVKTVEYTLTAEDYTAIAGDKTNKELAGTRSLDFIKNNQAFCDTLPAATYVPAFLDAMYPTADNTSAIQVSYNFQNDLPEDIVAITKAQKYALSADDYKAANASDVETHLVKVDTLAKFLAPKYDDMPVGNTLFVNYKDAADAKTSISVVLERTADGFEMAYPATAQLIVLQEAEFKDLFGYKYPNFDKLYKIMDMVPTYLNQKYPYAYNKKSYLVAFPQHNLGTAIGCVHFQKIDGVWTYQTYQEVMTNQFKKLEGAWKYDPSVSMTLNADNPLSVPFYQAGVDWVWENIDQVNGVTAKGQGYVSSYGTSEYYGGMDAYHKNVDWKVSVVKDVAGDEVKDMTDEEIVALMQERSKEVFMHALEATFPEADVVEGLDVKYTLTFPVYRPEAFKGDQSIVFKVISKGKFEFVSASYIK